MKLKENYSLEELISLLKEGKEKEFFYFHWKKFERKLGSSGFHMVTLGILTIILMLSIILQYYFLLSFSLFSLALSPIFLLIYILMMIFGYKSARKRIDKINQLTVKSVIAFILFMCALAGLISLYVDTCFNQAGIQNVLYFFNFFNIGLAYVIGVYLGYFRMVGVGEIHLFAVKIFRILESNQTREKIIDQSPCDEYILTNFLNLLNGLNKWCIERLNIRIVNFNELQQSGIRAFATNYLTFQKKFEANFNAEFLMKIQDYKDRAIFSEVILKIEQLLEVSLLFSKESVWQQVRRNLGVPGFTIFFTILGYFTGLILSFFY